MREELERIEIPDELGARERSWRVVEAAFAAREHVPRRVAPATRRRRCAGGGGAVRGGAQPTGHGGARRDPGRRRRRASATRALLASLDRSAARHLRQRRLGRRSRRIAPTARRLPRRELVAVRAVRRRRRRERAVGSGARRRLALVARTTRCRDRRAGRAPRPTRGSRTSTAPGFASSRVTARATGCSSEAASGPIAWRPGSGFVLAHVAAGGRVVLRDVATGRVVGRSERRNGAARSHVVGRRAAAAGRRAGIGSVAGRPRPIRPRGAHARRGAGRSDPGAATSF